MESSLQIASWHAWPLHVIPQHQLLGVWMQVYLLVHPFGNRIAAQMMLQQRQRYDQRHQPLPVVLDEAQELQPALGALASLDR